MNSQLRVHALGVRLNGAGRNKEAFSDCLARVAERRIVKHVALAQCKAKPLRKRLADFSTILRTLGQPPSAPPEEPTSQQAMREERGAPRQACPLSEASPGQKQRRNVQAAFAHCQREQHIGKQGREPVKRQQVERPGTNVIPISSNRNLSQALQEEARRTREVTLERFPQRQKSPLRQTRRNSLRAARQARRREIRSLQDRRPASSAPPLRRKKPTKTRRAQAREGKT